MIILMLYIAAFILLSGLMAAVDAAVLSVTRPEIEEMVEQGWWGAKPLRLVKQRLTRAVVVIVIFTNTINVLGPILVSRKAFDMYGTGVLGTITVVLTLGTILFSEIIPKSLGSHYAPLISRMAALPLQAAVFLLYPLVVTLEWISRMFTVGTRPIGTEQQIRSLVTIGRRAGYIESDEGHLIHRAFVLNDRTAEDLMTPREDLVGIRATDTVRQAVDAVQKSNYSRFPVFGRSMDDMQGVALRRDLLEAIVDGRADEPVKEFIRQGLVVEAGRRSDELLLLFRDRRTHLAVVRKQGKTIGVVTLEDVLEELVGEIEDETDRAERR